jgi:Tfp pilus assembly protein PilF
MLEHAGTHMPEITARFAAWERLEPGNATAPLLHAKALVAQLPPAGWDSRADEARLLLEKSVRIDGNSAEAQFELACLMERKHDYEKAASLFEKSIQLNPDDPVTHYRLARVYDRLGKKEEADEQRALHERLSAREKQDLDRRAASGIPAPH